MLYQLITQLSDGEREAVGAASVAAYADSVLPEQQNLNASITLSTQEEIKVTPRPLSLRPPQMQEGYRDAAFTHLLNNLCPLVYPTSDRPERDGIIREPSHSMISISRISSGRATLFDHMGLAMHPIALRLHRTRDYDEADRLDPSMMRMDDEQLLEILMSETQYARLIRCDQSMTPCTLARRHWTGHDLERNPHFDQQFDSRDIQKEVREVLAEDMAACEQLNTTLASGVSRKAERESAEATLMALLERLDASMDSLHTLAEAARDQAKGAAEERHGNLLEREVASLPASMRDQLKQLSDAGHPIARLLTVDPKHD